jgi:prevent-host-death family protein
MSEARERLSDVVDTARREHEPAYMQRRGKRLATIIDADDLDRLIELAEDSIDIAEAQAALDEEGEAVPWERSRPTLVGDLPRRAPVAG